MFSGAQIMPLVVLKGVAVRPMTRRLGFTFLASERNVRYIPSLEPRRVDPCLLAYLRGDSVEFVQGLLEEFLYMSENEDAPVPLAYGVLTDGGHDRGLPAAGRDDDTG